MKENAHANGTPVAGRTRSNKRQQVAADGAGAAARVKAARDAAANSARAQARKHAASCGAPAEAPTKLLTGESHMPPDEQQQMALQQLRTLLGTTDFLPPGELKFLFVMRLVAPCFLGKVEIDDLQDAHDAHARLVEKWTASNAAAEACGAPPDTPPLRRAVQHYLASCM
eukprot:scaffold21.g2169.t1